MPTARLSPPPAKTKTPALLWIDSLGGLAAGVLVLGLSGWLSALHGLPQAVLVFTAAANLVYGSYSLSLALRRRRTRAAVYPLIFANGAWTAVCFGLATLFWETITGFGIAHLIGEGLYVGGLALVEWRQRKRLVTGA